MKTFSLKSYNKFFSDVHLKINDEFDHMKKILDNMTLLDWYPSGPNCKGSNSNWNEVCKQKQSFCIYPSSLRGSNLFAFPSTNDTIWPNQEQNSSSCLTLLNAQSSFIILFMYAIPDSGWLNIHHLFVANLHTQLDLQIKRLTDELFLRHQ